MGSLGVIGPTRMPYDKIISMLECISHVLSDILTESAFVEDEQNDRKRA
jgi:transcriptional regulator of heat shock response